MDVVLEIGQKKVFASALEWPGWARSARTEADALHALLATAPRYRTAVRVRGFVAPKTVKGFTVVERMQGNASTDFGVPGGVPSSDARPLERGELARLIKILEASWDAFEAAAVAAGRTKLSTGPRGGGRDVAKMRAHVLDGQLAYLGALGIRYAGIARSLDAGVRAAVIDALHRRARGELPDVGPKGGARWNVRYAVRRSAWHALDHAWEIEDRTAR